MIRKVFHPVGEDRRGAVEAYHEFLVGAEDLKGASAKVRGFLDSYQLVRYGRIDIIGEDSLSAADSGFPDRLERGLEENRRRLRSFLDDLSREGFERLSQLTKMDQGHCSKTFHTVAHLLDGFFGIDSFFFNLPEDSHWVSDELRRRLESSPRNFMLLSVRGTV